MSGVNIQELDANDALDVIHFLFEEDMLSARTKEELDVKTELRVSLYENLYKMHYKYAWGSSQQNYSNDYEEEEEEETGFDSTNADAPVPVDPVVRGGARGIAKPYTSPTRVNPDSMLPFGRGIDAPLA